MAAIYTPLWPPEDTILTTTLYPAEETEELEFSVEIVMGRMDRIPEDAITFSQDMISGSYTQLRWFYAHSEEESITFSQDMISGSYVQLRWFYSHSDEESITFSQDMISGSYERKRIFADSPDEPLIFSPAIMNTCTMETV